MRVACSEAGHQGRHRTITFRGEDLFAVKPLLTDRVKMQIVPYTDTQYCYLSECDNVWMSDECAEIQVKRGVVNVRDEQLIVVLTEPPRTRVHHACVSYVGRRHTWGGGHIPSQVKGAGSSPRLAAHSFVA